MNEYVITSDNVYQLIHLQKMKAWARCKEHRVSANRWSVDFALGQSPGGVYVSKLHWILTSTPSTKLSINAEYEQGVRSEGKDHYSKNPYLDNSS